LNFADKTKIGQSVGEAYQIMNLIQQSSNVNAIGFTGDSPSPRDELRVNAERRGQTDEKISNNRGRQFSRRADRFCKETMRRIIRDIHHREFEGEDRASIDKLRSDLMGAGVSIEYFTEHNTKSSYSRLIGGGDPNRRIAIVQELVNGIQFIPGEHRAGILKERFAAITDDWEWADEVYSQSTEGQADQQTVALTKTASMFALGTPYPVVSDDVPQIQIPIVFQALRIKISVASQSPGGAFKPEDVPGFVAVGQYAQQLIIKLEEIGEKELANQYVQELQSISKEAEGPLQNLQQQSGQGEVTPEMQIKAQELELKRQTIAGKQQAAQFNQERAIRKDNFNEFQKSRSTLQQDDRIEIEKRREEREQRKADLELGGGF